MGGRIYEVEDFHFNFFRDYDVDTVDWKHCIQYTAILCIFVLSLKSLRNNELKATVEAGTIDIYIFSLNNYTHTYIYIYTHGMFQYVSYLCTCTRTSFSLR